MKQQIGSFIAFPLVILVGLGFGVFALKFWLERHQMTQHGIETTGVVTDLTHSSGRSHTVAPVVTYTTQTGDTLHYRSNIYSALSDPPEMGEKIKLWYDPANPQKVELGNERLLIIRIFLVTFLVFAGIGLHSLIFLIRQRNMYKLLRERGQVVQARFSRVVSSWKFEKAPIRVVATWTDPQTQITHTFMSDFLPGNMDLSEVEKKGNIPVTINPENPNQYWMDLSEHLRLF